MAAKLESFGLKVHRGLAKTGVVATLVYLLLLSGAATAYPTGPILRGQVLFALAGGFFLRAMTEAGVLVDRPEPLDVRELRLSEDLGDAVEPDVLEALLVQRTHDGRDGLLNPRLAGLMPFTILFYNWSGITSFDQMKPKPATASDRNAVRPRTTATRCGRRTGRRSRSSPT